MRILYIKEFVLSPINLKYFCRVRRDVRPPNLGRYEIAGRTGRVQGLSGQDLGRRASSGKYAYRFSPANNLSETNSGLFKI